MPVFVLTVLKIALLALLYFFIWRAVRAIVADLWGGTRRERRASRAETSPVRRSRGAPTKVVVLDEHGSKLGTYRLSQPLQIGRGASCEIRLSDTYASQAHARISNRNGSWVVEDLGSTNGTYLNQRKVTAPVALAAGDRIRIGKTTLELRR